MCRPSLAVRQLIVSLQGLSAVYIGRSAAHIDRHVDCLQDLRPGRAMLYGRLGMEADTAVAPPTGIASQKGMC